MSSSESSSSAGDAGPSHGSRKRQRNPEQWKKVKAKKRRNLGLAYESAKARGTHISKRKIGPPCRCGCFEKVGMDNIRQIFDEFWKTGDYNIQNEYLANVLKSVDVSRSRVKDRPSRRKRSISYMVKCQNEFVSVCAVAFRSIHDIRQGRVYSVIDKVSSTGIVEKDKRGKNVRKHRIADERKKLVMEHIKGMPAFTSHYSRAKSPNRKYLSSDLNINQLYSLYEEWMLANHRDSEPVSKDYYRRVFCKDFNLGFEPPKSDSCNDCDRMKQELKALHSVRDSDKIKKLNLDKELHLRRAKVPQQMMREYRANTDPRLAVISIDLQKTLATPRIFTSLQYYKRKLWTYNFGIHDVKTGGASMYLWDESIAKRGSIEIASCILHYIENEIDDEVDKIVVFSDNCGGQNKNWNLVSTYLRQIHSKRFKRIEHFFMVPGHSFLPCDRDFGHIEKFMQAKEVYTLDHYARVIANARSKNPFTVTKMQRSQFVNVEELAKQITKRKTEGVLFKNARAFIFDESYKQGFSIRSTYHVTEPYNVKMQKGKAAAYQPTFNLSTVPLPEKYPKPVKINPDKLEDIRSLMNYIDPQYKPYFDAILEGQKDTINVAVPGDEDDDVLDY